MSSDSIQLTPRRVVELVGDEVRESKNARAEHLREASQAVGLAGLDGGERGVHVECSARLANQEQLERRQESLECAPDHCLRLQPLCLVLRHRLARDAAITCRGEALRQHARSVLHQRTQLAQLPRRRARHLHAVHFTRDRTNLQLYSQCKYL